jgi:hypothetical protein
MNAFKLMLVLIVQFSVMQVSYAENRYSYNARIQCGNSSTTNNEYFYASNDMEAKNELMRLMNNNTAYKGRGCKLVELNSDKPQSRQQQSNSYEVRIQCGNSSSSSTEYFSAYSDLEAENEARRILNNNTGYRGRGCQITEMKSR